MFRDPVVAHRLSDNHKHAINLLICWSLGIISTQNRVSPLGGTIKSTYAIGQFLVQSDRVGIRAKMNLSIVLRLFHVKLADNNVWQALVIPRLVSDQVRCVSDNHRLPFACLSHSNAVTIVACFCLCRVKYETFRHGNRDGTPLVLMAPLKRCRAQDLPTNVLLRSPYSLESS